MSLKKTLLEMAEELKEYTESSQDPELLYNFALDFAMQLKGLARGLSDNANPANVAVAGFGLHHEMIGTHKEMSHQFQYAKAQEEAKQARQSAKAQEGREPRMVMCEGGPVDGDYIGVPGDMPVEARMMIAGVVYQLRGDGKLHAEPPASE